MTGIAPRPSIEEACMLWQSGRDTGSSPLRAAARVLTGVPHYFEADFIQAFDAAARENDALRAHASVLLSALDVAPRHSADEWGELVGFPSAWAGRGTPGGAHATQIRQSLASGSITMPLWGVSLSETVAADFGDRFTFEIVGEFPAIIATQHSGIKPDEVELITGGVYEVLDVLGTVKGGLRARLRFVEVVAAI
ncbi:hypothetical protein ACWIBQ_13415 [Microbacterium keratanolyticum]